MRAVILDGDTVAPRGLRPPVASVASRTAGLLPEFVHAAMVRCDAGALELAPEEARLLSPSAVPKRRAEFAAGRVAARRALEQAGLTQPPPLLAGARGQPLWPAGWVGSITHALGIAMAVVARASEAEALGIDLEARTGASDEIARHIATPRELQWVALDRPGWRTRLGVLFSAKESLYKAFYPSTGLDLDFLDVELRWDGRSRRFQVEILVPGVTLPPGWAPVLVAVEVVATLIVTAVCCRRVSIPA